MANHTCDSLTLDGKDAAANTPLGANKQKHENCFSSLFGFETHDLTSIQRFLRLLCQPSDPASLGILRFIMGFILMVDTLDERGLKHADEIWGNEKECRFPLFDFIRPLPLQWMYVVYLVMLAGTLGLMLGFKMRLCGAVFTVLYWYLLLLDKTSWNNHSYLFGLLAFLLTITDGNRYWSVDALLNPRIRNAHIPMWNYTLMRFQIFIVYFIAGLKKLDMDWMNGYSVPFISSHWVFEPFKVLLTEDQISLFIVHNGGLIIDLSVGFLLFFDKTRKIGLIISTSFHLMNSKIFSIGMFPYAMMGSQLIFCDMSWPRRFFSDFPSSWKLSDSIDTKFQPSSHCIYTKECGKSEKAPTKSETWKHNFASLFTVYYIAWQIFLPFSYGILKGYNGWINGLYGYSWDMMVHSWSTQQINIFFYDVNTEQYGYLDLEEWPSRNRRWKHDADMIKQYADCIADRLKSFNLNNVSLYFDIWTSLNSRFFQRYVDPRVDIIKAEWNPFSKTPWILPLMDDLSDWRIQFNQIEEKLGNESIVFVADFPGLHLENYVEPDFGNTTITVLTGEVIVEFVNEKQNVTLGPDQSLQVTADRTHIVHVVSESPACYMYMFVNTSHVMLMKNYEQFEADYLETSLNETLYKYKDNPNVGEYQLLLNDTMSEEKLPFWENAVRYYVVKFEYLKRSIYLCLGAVYYLVTNSSFEEFLNA